MGIRISSGFLPRTCHVNICACPIVLSHGYVQNNLHKESFMILSLAKIIYLLESSSIFFLIEMSW